MRKYYIEIAANGSYHILSADYVPDMTVYQEITQLQWEAIAAFNGVNQMNLSRCRIDPKTLIPFLAP